MCVQTVSLNMLLAAVLTATPVSYRGGRLQLSARGKFANCSLLPLEPANEVTSGLVGRTELTGLLCDSQVIERKQE